jgi:hypothetical protein
MEFHSHAAHGLAGDAGRERSPGDDLTSTAEIALHERCSERAVRITLSLAFLAPPIVKAAIEGRLPYGLTASSFSELPMLWEDQLRVAS